jgi:thiamine-phosphate pyrophosphorylase
VNLPFPPILVITDRRQCAEPLEARAAALFRGGCRWLSLREKDLKPAERRALLERLILVARPFGATVGIHDDLAAAMACNAPLHLPAASDTAAARGMLSALLGKSCHTQADVIAAARDSADYVTLSPFFPTASKPGYRPALAPTALNQIAATATLPVLALGGITRATLPDLKGGNLTGIAIMGEAMRAPDPQAWFADIVQTLLGATETL